MPATYPEASLGFRDTRFENFLRGVHDEPNRLQWHYDRLVGAQHPYARCAAGGLAMELALRPQLEEEEITLETRLGSLERAETCWRGADLSEVIAEQPDPEKKKNLAVAEFQRRQSLSSLPAMHVAASWRANRPSYWQNSENLLAKAQRNVLRLGEEALRMPQTFFARDARVVSRY